MVTATWRCIMEQATKDAIERIASMLAAGTPQTQIAEALGLSEGRISQLKDTDEFRTVFAAKQASKFQESEELNDGWNSIERRALEIVRANLRFNQNPDFALKAAMIANRATRRGTGNQPLPTNMGTHAVINLSVNFVQKLQNMEAAPSKTIEAHPTPAVETKRTDLMLPGAVSALLAPAQDTVKKYAGQGMFDLEHLGDLVHV